MKVVPKYTLLLGATVTAILSIIAFIGVEATRSQIEHDMRQDHRVVGRMLQASISAIWLDVGGDEQKQARAAQETQALLDHSNKAREATTFAWTTDKAGSESQAVEDADLVSRFPVVARGRVGTVVVREPHEHVDAVVRTQLLFSIVGIATILLVFAIASLVMGAWLVGRPVGLLVEQARRIGRGDFSDGARLDRRDELGQLDGELRVASDALARSIEKTAIATEARLKAVEQVRHSDRLATVGKLAAGIAHELGTPLSVVAGHAQMIAGGEVAGEAALASARTIDNEVTRMGKIVRQLLDFARRKGPEGTSCAPGGVAKRCASLLAVMAERHAVTLEVNVREPTVRALIDEDSLQQVLTNLIVNGIQAMEKGTLAITIERITAAPDPAGSPKPCLRIAVRDRGSGIPPEVESRMFEPFFTTKAPGDGTGLGLAVVHGIVADHQGWIAVETGAEGTTVSIYLEEALS